MYSRVCELTVIIVSFYLRNYVLDAGMVEEIRPGEYIVICNTSESLAKKYFPPFHKIVRELEIEHCPPPANDDYATTLSALGMDVKALTRLEVLDVPQGSSLKDQHFEGLKALTRINIRNGNSNYEIPFKGTGKVDLSEGDYYSIVCYEDTIEDQQPPLQNRSIHPKLVDISSCPPPVYSYAQALSNIGLDLKTLDTIHLTNTIDKPELYNAHLAGLNSTRVFIDTFETQYEVARNISGDLDIPVGETLQLMCLGNTVEDSIISTVLENRTLSVKKASIFECPPPRTTYAKVLESLGVNTSTIDSLNLFGMEKGQSLRPEHFVGLHLQKFQLSGRNRQALFEPSIDIFEFLIDITWLEVKYVLLPALPSKNKIQEASLQYGSLIGSWGSCSELRNLTVFQWDVPVSLTESDSWLGECPHLKRLILRELSESTVRRALIGAKALTFVTIENCALHSLTLEYFFEATELEELHIVGSSLERIQAKAFESQSKLVHLDLSHNLFESWAYIRPTFGNLTNLRKLNLSFNSFSTYCQYSLHSDTGRPLPLTWLSLHKTKTSRLCFSEWETLEYLDVSNAQLTVLEFRDLPSPRNHSVVVDLRGNPFNLFPREEIEFETTKSQFEQAKNVTVFVNLSLDCDCLHAWFARTLREVPQLTVQGALCSQGQELKNVSTEQLECDKELCKGCICRSPWHNNVTDVECYGTDLRRLPHVQNMRSLVIPGNLIEKIYVEDVPDTLLFLDIRNNHVAGMNAETAEALFNVSDRIIKLADNPFACDCENYYFLSALKSHRDQVEDYDYVTCVGTGQAIDDLDVANLCNAENERNVLVASSVGGALAVSAVIFLALVRRYKQHIKVFLYTHNCCLSCLHEEEIDSDRPYDAFLSFTHLDEEFVLQHLLPGLEQAPNSYKICVHFRDWVAGELIPTQIGRSVQLSKRTIIVLSRNFLESVWGMLEFRMAYMNSMREGRTRIIMVVLDDVVHDQSLDSDLRDYVASTTYVRWGEPWFWQKLRFALPHRREGSPSHTASAPAAEPQQFNAPHHLPAIEAPMEMFGVSP